MHMRRLLTSIFLTVILLFAPLMDRARQAPAAPKPQSTPPAQSPAPSQEPAQQSGQKIGVRVNLVDVLFTVLDRRNKLVPALEKTDFKIFDDKLPRKSVISANSPISPSASASCWTLPTAFATASSSSRTPPS